MTRIHVALLLTILAACGNDATRVRLTVAGPVVDHFEVRVGDHAALANPLAELELLIPDEIAGQSTQVQVWGLVGGQQVAFGRTTVTPALHASVDGTITLASVTCGAFCTEGTVVCDHDGTSRCEVQADGCLAYSTAVACPNTVPFCSNGDCQAQCSDECTAGQTECDTAVTMRTCGEFDSDSCHDWSAAVACASGQSCVNGACTGGTQTCTGDGDKCTDGDDCTIDDTCLSGVCSGDPKCTTAPANADPTCSAGTCDFACHDGYIKQGSGCVLQTALIFVTSTHSTGNLGGLAGADATCQSLATAAGQSGTFKAYLSDASTSVDARFVHSTRPYALVNGTVIAANYAGLTSGHVLAPIDVDETGASASPSLVWTGQSEGGIATTSCTSWTSSSATPTGAMLDTIDTDWTVTLPVSCDLSDGLFVDDGRLFCVQQLP